MKSHQSEPLRLCVLPPNKRESRLLVSFLRDAGYQVKLVTDRRTLTRDALAADSHIVLIPMECEESDAEDREPFALRALAELQRRNPTTQVILLTSKQVDLRTCCRAVELGAAGFVEARDGQVPEGLTDRIEQAAERRERTLTEQRELHSGAIFDHTGITGQSEVMAQLLLQARRAGMISDAPVVIYGESGTGKQLLAEAVHRMDQKRCSKPFLSINCAAISGTLADSALFGHKKGAFTGATEERAGYFRSARGGTVLLDEICELDLALQPKLLRVLQERVVLPVGSDVEEEVDVRVIAASNRQLEATVARGEFRLDLYQRLNVITLTIPPLRERKEDIPALVQFFLRRYRSYYPQPIVKVDGRVYDVLASTVGDGNVRELENMVRRILAFKQSGNALELSDIPPSVLTKRRSRIPAKQEDDVAGALARGVCEMVRRGQMTLPQMIDRCEELMLREAIATRGRTHEDVARQLGITRRTFYNKLQRHNLAFPPKDNP